MDSLGPQIVEKTIARKFGVKRGQSVVLSTAGTVAVRTPAGGNRLRVTWIGLSSPDTNSASVQVTVVLSDNSYDWFMGAPGAFGHGTVWEGDTDAPLQITLSGSQTVAVNFDTEEFT